MQSYLELMRDVFENGEPHQDRTGVSTLSVFGRQWRHDLRSGFPLLTTKRVHFRSVAEELFWFLSGSTNNNDLLARNVTIWNEWADEETGDLGPVYGKQWRDFEGVDQIANLIHQINTTPNSRRIIVSAWNPQDVPDMALPPCHTLWQVKIHGDSSLSLSLYARSIDTFLGLPFNIASYALLAELLAHVTSRRARELVISFGDLHIYKNHFVQVNEQLDRDPYPLPTLEISERLRGGGLEALLDAKWEDLKLHSYKHHPKIDAPVAV